MQWRERLLLPFLPPFLLLYPALLLLLQRREGRKRA
jgi:hypothetical protein